MPPSPYFVNNKNKEKYWELNLACPDNLKPAISDVPISPLVRTK